MILFASAKLQAERKAICGKCEKLQQANRCGACGCFIAPKVVLAASSCPDRKWMSVADALAIRTQRSMN